MPCSSAPGFPRCRLNCLAWMISGGDLGHEVPVSEPVTFREFCPSVLPAQCHPHEDPEGVPPLVVYLTPSTPTGLHRLRAAASACFTCTAGRYPPDEEDNSRWGAACLPLSVGPGWCVTRLRVPGWGLLLSVEVWPERPTQRAP